MTDGPKTDVPKTDVIVREVGPRDGLQAEEPLPVEARVRLIGALVEAGLQEIEAVSFVSPKAVPSMAGAAEVMAALPAIEGVRFVALVPNMKGAELALAAGLRALTVTISASPAYNEKNVRMTVEESAVAIAAICGLGVPVDAVVSCAFGSPYEGDIAPGEVAALGHRLLEGGASSVTYADTTGMATPRRVGELVAETGPRIGLHLHETRGTGLVNAYAALELGVRRFDTSVGGLGGSPFAAGAAGNLATEDLVHLLDDLGVATGVDLDRLLDASALAASLVGHPVPSRVAAAGPRSRLAPA
ncbi:MAG TPA: hydroxymethylglutaryl-CoA lyase [Acidimicrobiales bacterium]|nr:hydroxymethylglutaryl-CoA lyase [Acidimicrobiales bacterium]